MFAQNVFDALGERFTYIAAVTQQRLHLAQSWFAALQCQQGSLSVCHLCRGHRNGMRQPLGVHRNVALDARDLLARVIALEGRRVRVLHALRVHDQERA